MPALPGLPRPEDGDAPLRRLLGCAVALATLAAAVVASLFDVPRPVPSYALDHPAVWRMEVFVALLLALNVPLSLVASAFHGRLLTSLSAGPGGGGTEQITEPDPEQTEGLDEAGRALGLLRDSLEEGFTDLGRRVSSLERRERMAPDDETRG